MLIKSIDIKGMLSFRDAHLEMRPLNVLIGPNASGKSNLIEVMALLQAVPRDLAGFFRRSGGISDWMWKGMNTSPGGGMTGTLEALVSYDTGLMPLRYVLSVTSRNQRLDIAAERLENGRPRQDYQTEPFQFFQVTDGYGRLAVNWRDSDRSTQDWDEPPRQTQPISREELTPGQSVLRERKDPFLYQEMAFVSRQFDSVRLYREWNMGRNSAIRRPQPTDSAIDFLEEDFANLSLILNRLEGSSALPIIEEQLKRFYETYERVGVSIYANTAQLWVRERGLNDAVPATRLSDGTLRFLALLCILCHPEPPPLVCIEEPELGLHPDVIHQVAKLLMDASKRTQLIVTTHSAELIDHLWEDPESVVVCERYPDTGTEFNRLKKEELKDWLERYELGELWRTGQIGGNRF